MYTTNYFVTSLSNVHFEFTCSQPEPAETEKEKKEEGKVCAIRCLERERRRVLKPDIASILELRNRRQLSTHEVETLDECGECAERTIDRRRTQPSESYTGSENVEIVEFGGRPTIRLDESKSFSVRS